MEYIILGSILVVILSLLFTIKISYITGKKSRNNRQHQSISQEITSIVSAENRSRPVGEFVTFIKEKKPLSYNIHKNSNSGC